METETKLKISKEEMLELLSKHVGKKVVGIRMSNKFGHFILDVEEVKG